MPAKKTPVPRKKTVYELIGERGPQMRRGVDPLDDILLDEERELVREVKRIKLEAIVMKRRKEIERLKSGVDMEMGVMPSNTDFLNMAKFMAELTPEEAQRVRNAYSFFKLAEKGQSGGGMMLLPTLLNYAKTNPGASDNQLISYLKLMDSQLLKGIEISKAVSPQQSEDSTLKFMTLMKDLVIEGVRNPVMQALRENQPQQGVFDQIFTRPEVYNRFKELGMFGGGSTAKNSFDLDLERLRGDRELEGRKFELQMRKMILESDAKERRTDRMLSLIPGLSALFAGPIDDKMRQMGRETGINPQPTYHQTPNPVPAPATTILEINCTKCGHTEEKNLTGPVPETIACPECGNVMGLSSNPPGEDTVHG